MNLDLDSENILSEKESQRWRTLFTISIAPFECITGRVKTYIHGSLLFYRFSIFRASRMAFTLSTLTSLNGLILLCMMKGNLQSSHELVSLAVSHWIKHISCTYRKLPLQVHGVSSGLMLSDSWHILQKSPLVWLVWLELDPNLQT